MALLGQVCQIAFDEITSASALALRSIYWTGKRIRRCPLLCAGCRQCRIEIEMCLLLLIYIIII